MDFLIIASAVDNFQENSDKWNSVPARKKELIVRCEWKISVEKVKTTTERVENKREPSAEMK